MTPDSSPSHRSGPIAVALRRTDRFQQDHRIIGFPYAVVQIRQRSSGWQGDTERHEQRVEHPLRSPADRLHAVSPRGGHARLYGFFGVVIVLLTWIYLGAQLFLLAAESNGGAAPPSLAALHEHATVHHGGQSCLRASGADGDPADRGAPRGRILARGRRRTTRAPPRRVERRHATVTTWPGRASRTPAEAWA